LSTSTRQARWAALLSCKIELISAVEADAVPEASMLADLEAGLRGSRQEMQLSRSLI
jgi:hypothetical protein